MKVISLVHHKLSAKYVKVISHGIGILYESSVNTSDHIALTVYSVWTRRSDVRLPSYRWPSQTEARRQEEEEEGREEEEVGVMEVNLESLEF